MTLPTVILDWQRCPDGIAVVDLPPPSNDGTVGTIYDGFGIGRHFRFKSSRREQFSLANDFQDPIIVRFINATTEEALIAFFGRFGLPGAHYETEVESEIQQQTLLSEVLKKAASGESGLAGPAVAGLLEQIRLKAAFDYLGEGQSPRLALRAQNLRGFMAMEIALLGLVGAHVSRCEECNDLFLTGPMTERRSTAKFCKDLCRQRSLRRRKKGEDIHGHVSS